MDERHSPVLALKLAEKGCTVLVPFQLDLYESLLPAAQLLASAELGPAPADEIKTLLTHTSGNHTRDRLRRVGDCIAAWLFRATGDSGPSGPWNAVGAKLNALSSGRRNHAGLPLRICLHPDMITDPSMGYLPLHCIEFCTDMALLPAYGIRDPATPVIECAPEGRVKVLVVKANPGPHARNREYPHLPGLDDSVTSLARALDPLGREKRLFISRLSDPTPARLIEGIAVERPDVLVFAGHGYASEDGGGLICVDAAEPARCNVRDLQRALRSEPTFPLRLVVLISCEGFVAASHLLTSGLSAVIAMQPVANGGFPLDGVEPFGHAFFRAVARYRSMRQAMRAACKQLIDGHTPLAAAMPTLWLNAANDHLVLDSPQAFQNLYMRNISSKTKHLSIPNTPRTDDLNSWARFELVYIEQRLTEKAATPKPGAGALRKGPRKRPAPHGSPTHHKKALACATLPAAAGKTDVWAAIRKHHRVVVLAPPWTGKSTLASSIARSTQRLNDSTLPILIPFRNFAESNMALDEFLGSKDGYSRDLDIGADVRVRTDDGKRIPWPKWLYHQWCSGQALLILDGVDEVMDPHKRQKAFDRLPSRDETTVQPLILATSREIGHTPWTGFHEVTLAGLDPCDWEPLAAKWARCWARESEVGTFLKEIHNHPHRHEMARLPGQFVLMLHAYLNDKKLFDAEEELLTYVVDVRLNQRVASYDNDRMRRRALDALAFSFHLGHAGEPMSDDEVLAVIDDVIDPRRGKPPDDPGSRNLLKDLVSSGLVQTDHRGQCSMEPRWAAFCAAEHIATRLQESRPKDPFRKWFQGGGRVTAPTLPLSPRQRDAARRIPSFPRLLSTPEFRNVILHLAGLMEDATPLLRRIAREKDDILDGMFLLRLECLWRAKDADSQVANKILAALWRKLQTGPAWLGERICRTLREPLQHLAAIARPPHPGSPPPQEPRSS